jgi:predicted transposase/invertase (TIGR01784 family)
MAEEDKIKSKEDSCERVKLDQILKSLFNVSRKVLIEMMNSLFKENYDLENTEITFENNEFVTDDYDIIRGDLFLKISKEKKPYHYHIELQTKNDETMIIRMFEYGFKKAKEISRNSEEETVIYIPKQLVIFIEENKNIKNELKMKLIFPDKQEVNYIVPVLKCWEYDDKRIIEEKMYPLLPLQIFKLRYKMESIKRSKEHDKSKLTKAILEAKEMAEIVAKEGKELYDKGEIDGEDLHRILLAIGNLFEYLNEKYGDNKNLNEEVASMTKTLYDPVVEERGIERGIEKGIEKGENKRALKDAVNFLKLGVSVEIVAQGTGLTIDIIRELKKEIMN